MHKLLIIHACKMYKKCIVVGRKHGIGMKYEVVGERVMTMYAYLTKDNMHKYNTHFKGFDRQKA